MDILFALFYGLIYFFSGLFLFIINIYLFEKLTSYNILTEIFEMQNKALAHIIKGQILGQSIMIATIIYFLGVSYEGGFEFYKIINSLFDIFIFGIFGIIIFQLFLFLLDKFTPLTKEIIIDNNESLGMIVGFLIVGVSIILSVSLYSY